MGEKSPQQRIERIDAALGFFDELNISGAQLMRWFLIDKIGAEEIAGRLGWSRFEYLRLFPYIYYSLDVIALAEGIGPGEALSPSLHEARSIFAAEMRDLADRIDPAVRPH